MHAVDLDRCRVAPRRLALFAAVLLTLATSACALRVNGPTGSWHLFRDPARRVRQYRDSARDVRLSGSRARAVLQTVAQQTLSSKPFHSSPTVAIASPQAWTEPRVAYERQYPPEVMEAWCWPRSAREFIASS